MKVLLDTNICIALMRRNLQVRARMQRLQPGDCAVSSITAFELYHGLERCAEPGRERAKIDELLSVVCVLPFGDKEAARAAKVRHPLEQTSTAIGPFDVLIAGHALDAGLILASHNTREFLRIDGLTVEDWLQP
ncbi:MAG: type II toxin-antitoxin system VapC family toxin [Chthoniobacteraceae bacterium]